MSGLNLMNIKEAYALSERNVSINIVYFDCGLLLLKECTDIRPR